MILHGLFQVIIVGLFADNTHRYSKIHLITK